MIGLLNAYHFENSPYQQEYGEMAHAFLKSAFPNRPVKSYKPAFGEFPDATHACEAWIITGSAKGASDSDPWVKRLGDFVIQCHAGRRKLIGICFGHQLIAHYLGGRTERAKAGWGVGVRTFDIFETRPWMKPKLKQVSLLFSHQDQVVELPKEATLLGGDDFCPIQMYSIGNHILSLQGHPEFTPEFARARYDSRIDQISRGVYDRAIDSLTKPTQAREAGQWMNEFLKN